MKSMIRCRRAAVLAIVLTGVLSAPSGASGHGGAGKADPAVVYEWNQLLQTTIPGTAGVMSFRYYAMMHIAMFDAINSIQGDYRKYQVRVFAPRGASAEAAAAQAAHDVLVGLIPASKPAYDATLESRLNRIGGWRAASGSEVGKRVAKAILLWRSGDGSELPNRAYVPPALPGWWQPTAPGQVALAVQFGDIEPFGLLTPTQFLPAPPPLLNSPEYAADFNTVKEVGASNSAARTAEQTLLARLFAGPPNYSPNPFALWSDVARTVAQSKGLSLIQSARLLALVTAAMNDGIQTAHTSKYIYGLWRPITAIQRAGEDLNDQTVADPSWTPLLGTPAYPSHSSNLTCIGASAARAMARILRTDSIPFQVTWTGLGGNANVTRKYSRLSQLAEEGGLSRVYGGIHFMFEIDRSHESCSRVADYLYENYMQKLW
jgi:hypothetical protein